MKKNWKYYLAKSLDLFNKLIRWIIFGIIMVVVVLTLPFAAVIFVCLLAAMLLEDINHKARKWFNISKDEPVENSDI